MAVTINPNLAAELAARHKRLMEAAAEEAAVALTENLSSTTHGTGVHWGTLPHRSSAPGEYPVMQSGDLRDGVTSESTDGTAAKVVIEDDLEKLIQLEFAPPSDNPNTPRAVATGVSGGRAPMWMTMTDPETIAAMKRAMEDS